TTLFRSRVLEEEPTAPLRRTGRCLPYGHGITYWPLGEVLKEHLGILESDSPEGMRSRLGSREILGLTLGLDVAGDLHPLAVRDRLQSAWVEFAEALTHERPLILLVEDVHWAEEPLLDLLEWLARAVAAPLLLIATGRPEFGDRPWGRWGGAGETAFTGAALICSVFWTGPMYEALNGAEPDLRVLEDRDFVRRRSGSTFADEIGYAFMHALTREVAYESVPKARRARLHARFAEWLDRLGDRRDEHASILAHHYGEAVRPDDADLAWAGNDDALNVLRGKALHWLRRAAELAVGRYELAAGIALLHQGLALEPEREEQ